MTSPETSKSYKHTQREQRYRKLGMMRFSSSLTNRLNRLEFKKWKGRLAVVGTGEIPGVDSSFSSFSPTVAFSAVRMLVALTVDPWFSVESFDLSGAFLGPSSEIEQYMCDYQLRQASTREKCCYY